MIKSPFLNFMMSTANFLGVRIFRNLTVILVSRLYLYPQASSNIHPSQECCRAGVSPQPAGKYGTEGAYGMIVMNVIAFLDIWGIHVSVFKTISENSDVQMYSFLFAPTVLH